jgi:hypothetical protein
MKHISSFLLNNIIKKPKENKGNQIVLFWSTYDKNVDTDYDTWINKKINISAFHLLSLLSHTRLDNNTTLYTYQEFNKGQVPKGIKIKDANNIFCSKQAYKSLSIGHSIAHISDVVRLKVAADIRGIVMDMDAVVLRSLPEQDSWFASMPAKLSGGVAPKWSTSHPPLHINDNSWDGKALFNFPFKSDSCIKYDIYRLSDKIIKTLKEQPKKNSKAWNYVIWGVKKLISVNKKSKVFKPINFHPLPAWLPKGSCYSLESPTRLDGKTKLFGHTLPSIDEILKRSYVVHHFFESAAHNQGGYGVTSETNKDNTSFFKRLPDDCLLANEAKFVIGSQWREVLTKREKNNKL